VSTRVSARDSTTTHRQQCQGEEQRADEAEHEIGPMRAARRSALLELGLRDRRFGWPL
jgi:hypothetical protein